VNLELGDPSESSKVFVTDRKPTTVVLENAMELVRRIGRRGGLAGALTIVIGAACSTLGGDDGPEERFRANRAAWEALDIQSYDYTIHVSCFCPDEVTSPVRVAVRGGAIDSLLYVDSGEPVSERYQGSFPTIDGLFANLQYAFDRGAYSVSVEYDPALHFPRTIFVDYDRMAADDEFGLETSDFVDKS